MPHSKAEVEAAKRAIRVMLTERPQPTQMMIAVATGLSQGYIAKINRCAFERMNAGIRKVVEYSKMPPRERAALGTRVEALAARVSAGAARLAVRDLQIAEALADFLDRISE